MKPSEFQIRGNTNLKKVGAKIEYTPEQIQEYIKCSKDPIYFIKNYVRVVHVDRGVVPFDLYDYQERFVTALHTNRRTVAMASRQQGKALALDTKIPTPSGWTTMGEVAPGDLVIGADGQPTKVNWVSEIQTGRDCFKLQIGNETFIADADHQWEVIDCYRRTPRVLTTREMVDAGVNVGTKGQARFSIKTTAAVEFEEQPLPIDPYVLGVWLGDGTSRYPQITNHTSDDFIIKKVNALFEISSEHFSKSSPETRMVYFKGMHSLLKEIGVLQNKHIPIKYLRASVHQRQELLRGLMDTDGFVNKTDSVCELTLTNKALSDCCFQLISSLGLKAAQRTRVINGKMPHTRYTITFSAFKDEIEVFSLPRKLNQQQQSPHSSRKLSTKKRSIKSITPVESVPVKCIGVDNDDKLFLIGDAFVPTHNSISTIAYLLWFVLFKSDKNWFIVANKAKTATMLLTRLKQSYEWLPKWLQQGIVEWNKTSIVLENGSKVSAAATSSDGIRGESVSGLVIDELAFVKANVAEAFWTSVLPTISSGHETKVLISSTPCGFNLFWKLWTEAEQGINDFVPVRMHWHEVPGRDQNWYNEQLRTLGAVKCAQEVDCSFLGSSASLIPTATLSTLPAIKPIVETEHLKIFEHPKPEHSYITIADTARGAGGDYSVAMTIDVTQAPYNVVAVYRDNTVSAYAFPSVVHKMACKYNESFCLVENNDAGSTVAELLYREYEYVNMFFSKGTKLGHSSSIRTPGIRTTKSVKALGCSALDTLMTGGNLHVNDANIISEFGTFIQKGTSYEAESGYHDDLVMCLVLFAYLTQQPIFKDLTNVDTRSLIFKKQLEEIDSQMTPFGGFSDGLETIEPTPVNRWDAVITEDNAWLLT